MAVTLSRKGFETRETIVAAAKTLFYQKGFFKTSVSDICEAAGVKPGTLTYYFSTKDDLVREIYSRAFAASYDFVDRRLSRPMNSMEKNTIVAFVYFPALLEDPRTREFHYEMLVKGSIADFITQSAFPLFKKYNEEFKLNLSDRQLDDIHMAVNGISREIVTHFIENPGERTISDLVSAIYTFRARIFTIDEKLMKTYLANGLEFEQAHDHSRLRLLSSD